MHGPGTREYDITTEWLSHGKRWVHKACGRGGQVTIWGPGKEALRWARRHHRCPLAPRAWTDCNRQGQDHDWVRAELSIGRTYWRCRRCPVSTMTSRRSFPPGVLRP
jgi:hypothetical protein